MPNRQDFVSSTLEEDEVSPFVHVPAIADKTSTPTSSAYSTTQMPSIEIQQPVALTLFLGIIIPHNLRLSYNNY